MQFSFFKMADTSNVNTNTALGNVGRQMESILNNLGLGVLSERFARERMEPETVLSASDADLERLGVDTIGQRIRIRELCSKEMEQQQSGTLAALVQQERSLLFTPSTCAYGGRGRSRNARSGRGTGTARRKGQPWTPQFVCLANRFSTKVPSNTEKQILMEAGLGIKKIKLDLEDEEMAVNEKITSDEKDEGGNFKGFPQLKEVGGFEMMNCSPNCRDLKVLNCSRAAKSLRATVGGQSKIYLRPIQKSIPTKAVKRTSSTLKEKCHICQKYFLLSELRDHIWHCSSISDSDDEDLYKSPFDPSETSPPGSGLRQNLGQGESRGQGVSRGGKQIIILLIMF